MSVHTQIYVLITVALVAYFIGIRRSPSISLSTNNVNKDNLIVNFGKRRTVQGHILQSAKGNDYYAFQEIPFAVPPVGPQRFKVARRNPGWDGILQATENTRVCPQPIPTALPQDEDCLYLNVYTPVKPSTSAKLPVFVWIHGGGLTVWDGTIHRYSPAFLIDYNVVVVTIQYRLGPLGFLCLQDGSIPCNLGLKDQNLALKWVRKSILYFGGDPDQVTVGGESAGGVSVSHHILSDMSAGLFQGAIMHSGSALNTLFYIPDPTVYAFQLGQLLDSSIDTENTTSLLETLQNADVNDIIEASMNVTAIERDRSYGVIDYLIWAPTIEDENIKDPFVSRPMHESFENGDFAQVPLLAGFTSEEILWFLPSSPVDTPWKVKTWEEFRAKAAYIDEDLRRLVNVKLNIDDVNKLSVAQSAKAVYTNSTFLMDPDAYTKLSSDFIFVHGIVRQAELMSRCTSVYLFQFSYVPTNISGAPHTEELQYLWKGDEDVGYSNAFQLSLRNEMCKLWTNFIKYLNPTPRLDADFNYVQWQTVQPNDIKYMNINKSLEMRTNPRQYRNVSNIFIPYLREPFNVYM